VTVYAAFVRGVNVGGRAKLDMRELKRQVEKLGCADVRTYINSGNVVFRDRRSAATLARLLEGALGRRVAVRTLAQMEALCARIPPDWTNDGEQKTDVGFLLDEPGERLWHALRKDLAPRYVVDWGGAEVTARNVNTVRRLTELMRALAQR
jgi:uncharacterized protein (DUF1697 family)